MIAIVDKFNSPSHRIRVNVQVNPITDPLQWGTKLFRFPQVNLQPKVFTCGGWGCVEKGQ